MPDLPFWSAPGNDPCLHLQRHFGGILSHAAVPPCTSATTLTVGHYLLGSFALAPFHSHRATRKPGQETPTNSIPVEATLAGLSVFTCSLVARDTDSRLGLNLSVSVPRRRWRAASRRHS